MRILKSTFFICFILLNINLFSQSDVNNIVKYNIKDYFLLFPDSLIGNISIEQRQLSLKYKTLNDLWKHNGLWIIDTMDYRNGYLKLSSTGDGAGTEFEITYFIKKNKTREIAVNTIYWDITTAYSEIKFYSYDNNKWKDITKKVLPEINLSLFTTKESIEILNQFQNKNYILYKLPQRGKTITAKINTDNINYLLNDNLINKDEYLKIIKSLKPLKLIWNDGVFCIQQ